MDANESSSRNLNETILNFTKESRLTRDKKIATKNYYHKKNSKSVEYYKQLALQKKEEEAQMATAAEEHVEAIEASTKINHTIEGEKLSNQTNINTSYDDEVEALLANPKVSHKKMNEQQERSSERKKLFLFDSFAKLFRKRQIILSSSNNKSNNLKRIDVYTTLATKFEYKGKIHTLHLNCLIGSIFDFTSLCIKYKFHFDTPFKSEMRSIIDDFEAKYNAKEVLDNALKEIFEPYEGQSKIASYLPELEDQIFSALKKPSKQNKGFVNKIHSLHTVWKDLSHEVFHIEKIENTLKFSTYESSFPLARTMKRKFKIFIGPTNSGKTYTALNELAKARNGVYLGPLRLLAHEGKESLEERGVIANLITGEERNEALGATHNSSTIEMCSMSNPVEAAVIDEIQMIQDENRGSGWSQAVIGVPAKTIYLVGSEECLPLVIPVIENLGEEYEIVRFERKNKLHIIPPVEKLNQLKAGDCVVVFSRKSALEMKNSIEATGKKCSVIYGNLSPEVRKSEAKKFKNGENPILVATDAIGMGLNLPINRILFSTMEKFDGNSNRLLTISEVKQIAGRAGRFGMGTHGEVGLLFENNKEWAKLLNVSINQGYERAKDTRVSVAPNLGQVQTICDTLGKQELYSALVFFTKKMLQKHELYKTANLDDMINIARLLKDKEADLETTLTYACVPVDIDQDMHMSYFFRWFNAHQKGLTIPAPEIPDMVRENMIDSVSLFEAELFVKICMCYRWLHYKYPETYFDLEGVSAKAKETNEFIERALNRHIKVTNMATKNKKSGGRKK